VAQIFKEKYYPHGNVLESGLRHAILCLEKHIECLRTPKGRACVHSVRDGGWGMGDGQY
jgi:hypothetical protein